MKVVDFFKKEIAKAKEDVIIVEVKAKKVETKVKEEFIKEEAKIEAFVKKIKAEPKKIETEVKEKIKEEVKGEEVKIVEKLMPEPQDDPNPPIK